MKYARLIASGVDPGPALSQLAAHPELWDRDNERTTPLASPHAQASDIWLRTRPRREIDALARFGEPHFPEFYAAWLELPALHPTVFSLMCVTKATSLGFMMLSRIPPGGAVLPHTDRGWHADHFDHKFYFIMKANDRCINRFPGEEAIMKPGEVWRFENRVEHSVENNGDDERIAMIVTMRVN